MTGVDGMTLLYVPAGEFTMGSEDGPSNERPVHIVNLDAFWIDQTEVTNAMYTKCVDAGICDPPSPITSFRRDSYYGNADFNNYPVIHILWDGAKTYCSWVDRRLPTEAEWEKAARGTDGRTYPWGNDKPDHNLLNYFGIYGTVKDTSEVGNYPAGASPYGALDMAGNVTEWVADWFDAYLGNTTINPNYGTTDRVLRGGSWSASDDIVRSSKRDWINPAITNHTIGFRCAMDAE
jgi:serine/threonine-protein kinase